MYNGQGEQENYKISCGKYVIFMSPINLIIHVITYKLCNNFILYMLTTNQYSAHVYQMFKTMICCNVPGSEIFPMQYTSLKCSADY